MGERMLYDWLLHQQLNSVNVSEQMAKEKADALCKACSPSPDYKFSIKWFDGFKTHYNINFSDDNTSSQPGTSADPPDVKPFDGVFFQIFHHLQKNSEMICLYRSNMNNKIVKE